MIHTIDLNFLGYPETIATFLLITAQKKLVLIDSGPHATLPKVTEGVQKLGYQLADIQHVFLTHIHLDHAGAAWAFAQHGAKIYVHPAGHRHLANPEKLMSSARQIYQNQMDTLWGQMNPIAEEAIQEANHLQKFTIDNLEIIAHHTPGHASHHIAWQVGDVVFAGDVAGIKIGSGPVIAPMPPPDIDIEAWQSSIDILKALHPKSMFLAHFGEVTNTIPHLEALAANMHQQANWVREHYERGETVEEMLPKFTKFSNQILQNSGVEDNHLFKYEGANPAFMSVAGLVRYLKKLGLETKNK